MSAGSEWWWVTPLITAAASLGAAFGGAWVGSLLTSQREERRHEREVKAHWAALRAEVEFCGEQAAECGKAAVPIPAYRLPVAAYEDSYPRLLALAPDVDYRDRQAIMQYYTDAESFNRGLDFAQEAPARSRERRDEVGRVMRKALHLMPGNYRGEATRYDPARAAVCKQLRVAYPSDEIERPSPGVQAQRAAVEGGIERMLAALAAEDEDS